jgi:cation diffusion facilitator CzcD-associated flavoprotein CzcO
MATPTYQILQVRTDDSCKATMRFLVIGGGASGLATAKVLLEADAANEVVIVEAGGRLGGTYSNKSYENARLVSSKVWFS